MIISADPDTMTDRQRLRFVSMVAAYAGISLDQVHVVAVTATNSSRIRLCVPLGTATLLIEGFRHRDPRLWAFMDEFELLCIERPQHEAALRQASEDAVAKPHSLVSTAPITVETQEAVAVKRTIAPRQPIFAYIAHRGGAAEASALELLQAANRIDPDQSVTALVCGWGVELDAVCSAVRKSYSAVWRIANEALAYPNAEQVRSALGRVLSQGSILLISHDHFGIDLSPGLSIRLKAAYVPDVVDIEALDGKFLNVVREEFGGQISAHLRCDVSSGAVITIRPGVFRATTRSTVGGNVVDKSAEIGELPTGRLYLGTVAPQPGDLDITTYPILVSIGRGIGEQENVAIAEELADALGGAVSCSKPVADARWLDRSRQIGSSGQTVAPRVYLACGISGSFQHMAGIKGDPFIVAINKNPNAPVFRVAHVGIVGDLLEFLPLMTEMARALACGGDDELDPSTRLADIIRSLDKTRRPK